MKSFDCKMCGKCCYGDGGIRLTKKNIERISEFLNMPKNIFLKEYCETRNNKLYIKTGENKYCIFFDFDQSCLIHTVKPRACTSWPFYDALIKDRDSWSHAMAACPGINPNSTHEEFVRESKE